VDRSRVVPAPVSDVVLERRTARWFVQQGLPLLAERPDARRLSPSRNLVFGAPAMTIWAVKHVFERSGDVFRLATRALPLLLLFMTFLFINTEVWQVAGDLAAPVLWATVGLFLVIGVAFLAVRLPDELDRVDASFTGEYVVRACAGTPLEERVTTLDGLGESVELAPNQRRNLLLVLLITQLVQVALLAVAVWGFFVVFGTVAIGVDVQTSWLGHAPAVLIGMGGDGAVTRELLRVATFLAAFAGLYFTVYAVTDQAYREEFFSAITDRIERTLGVRRAYLALRRQLGAGRDG
jgi:hypothetical protein